MKYQITDRKFLFFFIGLYIALFLVFYPATYTTIDEGNFLRSALLFLEGRHSIIDPEYQLGFGYVINAYYPFFIGQAIVILPFVLTTWQGAFLSGMFLHIVATLIFYLLAIKGKRSLWYVPLFLFFPYFIFYSTTLFSDFTSGPIILAAFYCYLKEQKKYTALSGVLFGFAAVLKYTNIIAFLPFLLYTLIKNRQKMGYLIAGILPLAVFILAYNAVFFGGPFDTLHSTSTYTGHDGTVSGSLQAFGFLERFFPIAFRLAIILPLLVISPFFYKGKGRAEIIGAYLLFLVFWGSRLQSGDGFNFGPSTLTRYMLPVLPLILLTYPDFVQRIFERLRAVKILPAVLIVVSLALIVGAGMLLSTQHAYLNIHYEVLQDIHANTPDHALIISEAETNRYFMEAFGDRRFLDTFRYDDFTEYVDDSTFILHKTFEEGVLQGPHLEWSQLTEDVIEELDTELVFEKEYPGVSTFISTRPFTIQIFKVISSG